MQQTHRPGPLHQTNKPHKGGSGRKTSATNEIKSKIVSLKPRFRVTRIERLNQAQQTRKLKQEKAVAEKRKIGCDSHPPLVIGVLDNHSNTSSNFLNSIKDTNNKDALQIRPINERSAYVLSSRLKMRFKLVALDSSNLDETLDTVKTVDMLILLHDPRDIEAGVDFTDSELLRIIHIHCLPTLVHVINGLESKTGENASKLLMKAKRILRVKVGDEKLHVIERSQDYLQLFNIIGNCKRNRSLFKDTRPVVISDHAEVIENNLAFLGFVRKETLNPNDLVQIIGYGEYQIEKIDILPDVVSLKPQTFEGNQVVETLRPDPMRQESLDAENDVDPMEGEQTWPTAEELAAQAERINTKRVIKKLPAGTSEYQGAWIPESDEEALSDVDDEDWQNEMGLEVDEEDKRDNDDNLDDMYDNGGDTISVMDVDTYDENHSKEKELKIMEKLREARMNEMFPDEIDTPFDVNARERFARYRGLKSFRTSHWDPQENLPPDYSRIFQFQNFKQTRRRVLSQETKEGADPGNYVRIHLSKVPQEIIRSILNKRIPPSVAGLLKHERKMTVMNFLIKRVPGSDTQIPVKSKDELIFYVGYRKFKVRPLFTTHGVSSKYKYERFLKDDVAMVATTYAPITFPPCPVLVFRAKANGEKELVASGSVLDSDPSRLIIKRIRLSGHPFKIHSKTAVVRFMFFNQDDVMWFKPVELITKYNRRGHISEPLGTHGHMKCTFDKKIRSDDCVFMNLYKRVFPKWTYIPIYES